MAQQNKRDGNDGNSRTLPPRQAARACTKKVAAAASFETGSFFLSSTANQDQHGHVHFLTNINILVSSEARSGESPKKVENPRKARPFA